MLQPSSALLTLLNGESDFLIADLFTFRLATGETYRWTTLDLDVVYPPNEFAACGKNGNPGIVRGTVEKSIGLAVSTLDVTLLAGDNTNLLNVPLPLAAHNGAFDNAQVDVDRAFFAQWGDVRGTPAATIPWFYGQVGGVDPTSTDVVLHCRDVVDTLDVQMPRNLFLPTCAHLLYDAGCTLSKAAFTFSYAVGAGASSVAFKPSAATGKPAGYFETGVLQMTSGAAAGSRRAVVGWDGTTFNLAMALPAAPAQGDTFTVTAGCSRELSICTTRFNNRVHWRGFKDVPQAENAV